ncbi:zinc-binding dehydrogenase [Thalassomonas viridans]|uniref:Zinc-binding dehydrogenase n=1 Tax=Thalassomonas viridans TaxID=137584 RepID=A0AAF0CDH8_9GAMM|nr:zinc-binding dehydrogenase [Thalassomonas viridans]WDE09208.1 zinc-binding dehydrogenase [Thalassomonas viridans]
MAETRNVWKTRRAGAIGRLKLVTENLGPLAPDSVRVEIKAVGLNFADIFALTGLYSATPKGAFIPGLEYSGIVTEVGDKVTDFRAGDQVMGVTRFGGYADRLDTRPEHLQPLPDEWSFTQGAAYLVQTLTAWYALSELGNLKKGQQVLVQSAAGGVGLQAMKICRALGAHPVGFVASEEKAALLKSFGFEHSFVRQAPFAKQLKQLDIRPDLVLDAIGGEVQYAGFNALKPMGRLVVFGAAEFTPGKNRPNYLKAAIQYLKRPRYDVMDMISENKSVMAFNLIWLWNETGLMTDLVAQMDGIDIAPPHVGHTYAFAQAHQAIEHLRSGTTVGKVVLTL